LTIGTISLFALLFIGIGLKPGQDLAAALSPSSSDTGHYNDMVTPHGHTDWTAGVVTAKGFGVPPKNPANALQARESARTAAWSVALRNLLEVVKGVYVDSTTTVNNYVTTNDEIRTRVEGMVKGAKVVKEQELADGSYETTVEMKLAGDLSSLVQPKMMPKADPLPQYKQHKLPSTTTGPAQPKAYSGLVVDARGTGAKAGMYPRIVNEQGEEAYSVAYVAQKPSPDDRIVIYVPDPVSAQAHPRVTAVPLTVKALRSEGSNHTDLVISDADAQTIHGVPEHFRFLKQAKVLIILEEK
jgi:hypothetical protein